LAILVREEKLFALAMALEESVEDRKKWPREFAIGISIRFHRVFINFSKCQSTIHVNYHVITGTGFTTVHSQLVCKRREEDA
jgi:hypothetical protein